MTIGLSKNVPKPVSISLSLWEMVRVKGREENKIF